MRHYSRYASKAIRTPPHRLVGKIYRVLHRELRQAVDRRKALRECTYGIRDVGISRLLPAVPVDLLRNDREWIAFLSEQYLEHRFDLLGSGWAQVKPGMRCVGVEGRVYSVGNSDSINSSNRDESVRIRRLIDRDYVGIDWQIDFKSGFRWSEATWYRDIPIEVAPGADVKVPWELARMQHLPILVWAFTLSKQGERGFRPPERYFAEFRNQVLDFISANPPQFGVNWACAMDVAIRVSNWLVAYDLFRAQGAEFDGEFTSAFASSVHDHGAHIFRNLEKIPGAATNNHYLCDLIGLLMVGAFLAPAPETDAWLELAVREIPVEMQKQFHSDGGSFESSVCYHRLSAEALFYAAAWMKRLGSRGAPGLEPALIERMERMAEFSLDLTKPLCGRVPQIGDNDSGRFFKLRPEMTQVQPGVWQEEHLDHRHLLAAAAGLFDRADFGRASEGRELETFILRQMLGGKSFASSRHPATRAPSPKAWAEWDGILQALPGEWKREARIQLPPDSLQGQAELRAYPDFGIYIYRWPRVFLSIRCGSHGQEKYNGHAHNDQLAIELCVDGVDWIRDPGTYLYTPAIEKRNQYRSVFAHFAPAFEGLEPSALDLGVFSLGKSPRAECLYFGEEGFLGRHLGYACPVFRRIRCQDHEIEVLDFTTDRPPGNWHAPASRVLRGPCPDPVPFSPGYGMQVRDA